MKPQPNISEKILRVSNFNIFKWTSNGVVIKLPNRLLVNLDELCCQDKNNALDLLEMILEQDIPKQQIDDIKEVKEYLFEKYF